MLLRVLAAVALLRAEALVLNYNKDHSESGQGEEDVTQHKCSEGDSQDAWLVQRPNIPATDAIKERHRAAAKTLETRWKMPHAVARLSEDEINKCGSCGGIGTLQERTVAASQHSYELKEIFYVNPKRAKDRRHHMERFLNETARGYKTTRWPGITQNEISEKAIKEFTSLGRRSNAKHDDTVVACYLSQARLLKHIQQQDPEGEGLYVVLEDDVKGKKDWVKRMMVLLNQWVPEDWDIFKFGYNQMDLSKGVHPVNKCIKEWSGWIYGNHGYVIRPKSIPRILEVLAAKGVMDIDGAMQSHHEEFMRRDPSTGLEHYKSNGAVVYASTEILLSDQNHQAYNSQKFDSEMEAESGTI